MTTMISAAYIGLCLLFFGNALHWLASHDGRPRSTGGVDYFLLVVVALASSAAWLILLPVYGAGWLRSARGRDARKRALRPLRRLRPARLQRTPLHEHA